MKNCITLCLVFTIMIHAAVVGQDQVKDGNCCDYYDNGQNVGIEGESFGIALGDLDGDGDLDAVKVDAYNDIELFENDGNASFTFMQSLGNDGWRYGVRIADIDLDEDMDIVVAGFGMNQGCEVYKNDGSGTFSTYELNIASTLTINKFGLSDLNGDHYPDLFLPSYSGGNSQVWMNDGSGFFVNTNQSLAGQSCTEVALGDLDGDGDRDAYVSATNGSFDAVWINDGNGFFTNSGQLPGLGNSYGVDLGDIDLDGDLDAAVASWTVPSQVWINDGNGSFSAGFVINNNNYAKSIKIRDHDYDYLPDIFIGSYGSPGLQVWHNTGSGNFELCYSSTGDVYAHDFDIGDLDNNLMPDAFVGNFSSGSGDRVFIKTTPSITVENVALCHGDSIFLGGAWRQEAGVFLDALNCDTLVQSMLSVVIIDTSVSVTGATLTANQADAEYQWYDCATWLPIPGAENQSFTPEFTGHYAVEITKQNCTDTSGCHFISLTGLFMKNHSQIKIYPNPADRIIYFEPGSSSITGELTITDPAGKTLIVKPVNSSGTLSTDVSSLSPGVYILKVTSDSSPVIKIIGIRR